MNASVSIDELTRSIELYCTLKKYIDDHQDDYDIDFISNELYGYIHNTIAYTYQEMAFLSNEKEFIENAEKEYYEVFKNYKENGRYYRNFGTFLERTNKKEEALENYKKAIDLNKSDYKAYNNYYALKLNMIESDILDIMDRKNIELFSELEFKFNVLAFFFISFKEF